MLGTYPTTATSKAEQLADDQAAVSAKKAFIVPNADILGVNDGTLDIEADNPPPPPVQSVGVGL